MRRISVILAVALLALSFATLAAGSAVMRGEAELEEFNDSGIEGTIRFRDNGSRLVIRGRATGMNPSDFYVSLIYDIGSFAEGPGACEPSIFVPSDPNFILPTMFVGVWSVDANGRGRLSETNIEHDVTGQRVYVPLSKIRTISIRAASLEFDLAACGEVETEDDD